VQTFLAMTLGSMEQSAGFFVVTEQRARTHPRRFRVPDVCVVLARPVGPAGRRIVTEPPFLCVEILSPEDSMVETLEKVREYLSFGVEWVWIIDPVTCAGEIHTQAGVSRVEDRVFTTDRFRADLAMVKF
jgi:Uma2 family endonuclease